MIKKNKIVSFFSYTFLSLLLVGSLTKISRAQSTHLTPINLALGGGGTAYMEGFDANFINPANLMLDKDTRPAISVGILGNLSTRFGGSLVNIGVYNKYFTKGLDLTGSLGNEVLDNWFGSSSSNMRRLGMNLDVIPLGLTYSGKNWVASLAFRSRTLMDVQVSRGFAELGLFGLDSNIFSTPQAVDMSLDVNSFYEISAGYSRQVWSSPEFLGFGKNVKLFAGIAPKLLMAGFTSSLDFTSTLQMQGASASQVDMIRNDFQYTLETSGSLTGDLTSFYNARISQSTSPKLGNYVSSPQASDFIGMKPSGVGLDMGATMEMDVNIPFIGSLIPGPQKIRIGASLTDLGAVNYHNNVGKFTANNALQWDGFTLNKSVIDSKFNGSQSKYMSSVLRDSIGTGIYESFVPSNLKSISRPLPTMINLGAQIVTKKLSLSLDLNKGFTRDGTTSRKISFSTGLEYRVLRFLPLRIGLRMGGYSATSFGAGFGLDFRNFQFDLAAATTFHSINNGSSYAFALSGLKIMF